MDYFLTGLQVQPEAALPQPLQTLSLISRPHFLHGEHPHVWHMVVSLVKLVKKVHYDG